MANLSRQENHLLRCLPSSPPPGCTIGQSPCGSDGGGASPSCALVPMASSCRRWHVGRWETDDVALRACSLAGDGLLLRWRQTRAPSSQGGLAWADPVPHARIWRRGGCRLSGGARRVAVVLDRSWGGLEVVHDFHDTALREVRLWLGLWLQRSPVDSRFGDCTSSSTWRLGTSGFSPCGLVRRWWAVAASPRLRGGGCGGRSGRLHSVRCYGGFVSRV